ncbi:MAG: GTP 3',8-cyclase MoaA [Sulfolobales archaeon]
MIKEVLDRYGRPVKTLRITVTHRCNYNCFFCHMEGEDPSDKTELSHNEIILVAKAFSRIGVKEYKITGGEPLLREDIENIINSLKYVVGASDVSLTTNGFFLEEKVERLRKAGLDRINISIHSLRREIYRKITGHDVLDKVLRGFYRARKLDFKKIKINVVILKGLNDGEIPDFIELIRGDDRLILQLIELHPVGFGKNVFNKYFMSLEEIEKKIIELSSTFDIRRDLHNRPIYHLRDGGYIEIVKPVSNPIFCAGCTRLRLTSNGYIRPCLMKNSVGVDLKPILRNENLDEEKKINEIIKLIYKVIEIREPSAMWRIDPALDYLVSKYNINYDLRQRVRINIPKRPVD